MESKSYFSGNLDLVLVIKIPSTCSASLVLFLFFYTVFPVVPFGTEAGDTPALVNELGEMPSIDLPIPFPFLGLAHTVLDVSNSTNKSSHSP